MQEKVFRKNFYVDKVFIKDYSVFVRNILEVEQDGKAQSYSGTAEGCGRGRHRMDSDLEGRQELERERSVAGIQRGFTQPDPGQRGPGDDPGDREKGSAGSPSEFMGP